MAERVVRLNGKRLRNESEMTDYLHEVFGYPAHSSHELQSVFHWLQAYEQDVLILLGQQCVRDICENAYAFSFLMALGRAAEGNDHLQIRFDAS